MHVSDCKQFARERWVKEHEVKIQVKSTRRNEEGERDGRCFILGKV